MRWRQQVMQTLYRIENKVDELLLKGGETMALIDDVLAGVADESTVDDSIITLLNNIAAQLKAAGAPPATVAQLQSVLDAVNANKAKLNAAILANTPPPGP